MQYMFLLFDVDEDWEPTPEMLAPWAAFDEASAKIATQVSGEALQPSRTATVVSVRDGKTLVTDGPFVDSKEQLGGYYVFDCESPEVALKVAEMIPMPNVEVRPVIDFGPSGG